MNKLHRLERMAGDFLEARNSFDYAQQQWLKARPFAPGDVVKDGRFFYRVRSFYVSNDTQLGAASVQVKIFGSRIAKSTLREFKYRRELFALHDWQELAKVRPIKNMRSAS